MKGNVHDYDCGDKCLRQKYYFNGARMCEIMNGSTMVLIGDSTTGQMVSTLLGSLYFTLNMTSCRTCGYMCTAGYRVLCSNFSRQYNKHYARNIDFTPIDLSDFYIFEARNDFLAIEFIKEKYQKSMFTMPFFPPWYY